MLNHITIMGRLTRDPELRFTQSQTPVASFTLAVDRDFAGRDGGEKQTDFIDCVAWRQSAEFVNKYFAKGSMAVVAGHLQMRDWTDRDGNKRRNAEVMVENIYFGEAKKNDSNQSRSGYNDNGGYNNSYSGGGDSGYNGGKRSAFSVIDEDDDDLPF